MSIIFTFLHCEEPDSSLSDLNLGIGRLFRSTRNFSSILGQYHNDDSFFSWHERQKTKFFNKEIIEKNRITFFYSSEKYIVVGDA